MSDTDRLIELWQRLVDNHRVSVTEHEWHGPYGSHSYPVMRDSGGKYSEVIDVAGEVARKPERGLGAEWYEITLADYSDYGGTDYDAANVRTLGESFDCEVEGIAYGGERAYVVLGAEWDPDQLEALVEAIESLDDYPIIDEQDHSAYIDELADEAWDQWIRDDFDSDAAHLFDDEATDEYEARELASEFLSENEEALKEAYYAYEGNDYWYAESATSVVNPNHAEAIEHAVRTVRKALTTDPNQLELICD